MQSAIQHRHHRQAKMRNARRQWRGVDKVVSEDVRASFHSRNITPFGEARMRYMRGERLQWVRYGLGKDYICEV